jgi:lipopolysaccharide transport system permease protein
MLPTYQIIKYRSLAELRAEIRRGYLGVLWWIIEPILYMSVFFILFGVGLRKGGIDAVPFLLTGLVPWKWFATCVGKSGNILGANSNILKQVNLPIYIFPSVTIVINTVKFIVVFFILITFLMFYSTPSFGAWWALLPVLFVQLVFTAALVFWLAAIVPIIPDLHYIIPNLLMLLFFISGIFFDLSSLSENVRSIFMLNPMAILIDSYRAVLIHGSMPSFTHLTVLFFISAGLLLAACRFLAWYAHEYPKVLR